MRSRELAALIGPSLIAITLSEALNLRIFANNAPTVVYLNGAILFVAGFAIIRAHNVWTWRWPVAVTLTGWLAAALGLARMFAPEMRTGHALMMQYAAVSIVFGLGSFLSFKAYAGGGQKEE